MTQFRIAAPLKVDRSSGENYIKTNREGVRMKRALFAVVAASLLCAMPSIAANGGQPGQGSGVPFEQRKAEIVSRIDQRLVRLQEARACVSAAASPEALRACLPRHGGATGQGQGHQRNGQ